MLDYIIVGFGLSGLSFVERLEKEGKTYIVFEDGSQKSSRVAGGLYNPVILKRFTAAWQAVEQLEKAVPFYESIEAKLNKKLIYPLPIYRRFNSVEEQNTWFEACDKPVLERFLSANLLTNSNTGLDIPYHFGEVKGTGRIDIQQMLSLYLQYIDTKESLKKEVFEYDQLQIEKEYVVYKGFQARHIVFCEGFGVKNNPFFSYLPLVGNKGEYLIIKSEKLKLNEAVKSSVFIIPLGNDLYKVGATYNNKDKTPEITTEAKEELQKKLNTVLRAPYEVVDQVSGIRPTVRDRRPLLGTHPVHKNVHILNGLGSRGILIGPTVGEHLFNFIEQGTPLEPSISIERFKELR